jgi:hypothetical protein
MSPGILLAEIWQQYYKLKGNNEALIESYRFVMPDQVRDDGSGIQNLLNYRIPAFSGMTAKRKI